MSSGSTPSGKTPFIGVKQPDLDAALASEGVAAEQWQHFYNELTREDRKGCKIVKFGDHYHYRGRRPRRGEYASVVPEPWQLVREAAGETVPSLLLFDWYRQGLRQRYHLHDTPKCLQDVLSWCRAYNKLSAAVIKRSTLLDLGEGVSPLTAEGLVDLLSHYSVLHPVSDARASYQRNGDADGAFVTSSLFGRSTGISGLDYLFYGGIRFPTQEDLGDNISVAISGSPGMGKSTLGLALLMQCAARGGINAYLTIENDNHSVARQVAQFHSASSPYVEYASSLEAIGSEWCPASVGLLLAERLNRAPYGELADSVSAIATELDVRCQSHQRQEKMLVVDSLNPNEDGGSEEAYRSCFHSLAESLRSRGWTVVFLLESDPDKGSTALDYTVDVDIRLRKSSRGVDYQQRTLEIAKSRWQMSHRGEHHYSIATDRGMCVYPSTAAGLTAALQRSARLRYQENPVTIDPGIENFNRLLGSARRDSGADVARSRVAWWHVGSVTAFIGERGTLKTDCAERFVRSTEQTKSHSASALIVHFGDEFPANYKEFTRANRKPTEYGVRYDLPIEVHSNRDGINPTVTTLLFRSGYLASGHVMAVLRSILAEKRAQQVPITRAAITDLGNIGPDFPMLKQDPALIASIRELMCSNGITSVLVYSLPKHGAYDSVVDQIRSLAENIVAFDSISLGGKYYGGIRVERSGDATHTRGTYELRRSDRGKLSIEPTFDLMIDPLDGTGTSELRAAKVKFLLHADTELQSEYGESLRRAFRGVKAYEVDVVDAAESGLMRDRVPNPLLASERALWIVQRDGYSFDSVSLDISGRHSQHGKYCNLAGLSERLDRASREMISRASKGSRFAGSRGRSATHGVPYILNPSMLVAKDAFVRWLGNEDEDACQRLSLGEGDYTWGDVCSCLQRYLGHKQSTANSLDGLFGGAIATKETLSCCFLEILCSVCNSSGIDWKAAFESRSRGTLWFEHGSDLRSDKDYVLDAARLFYSLYRNTGSASASSLSDECKPSEVLWRHWYTSFRQQCALESGGNPRHNPGYTLLRLPTGVWSCGDWEIGILEGSVGARKGADILYDELVNRSAASVRAICGGGLSPYADLYDEEHAVLPVAKKSPSWFKSYVEGRQVIQRGHIYAYEVYQYILCSFLDSMLQSQLQGTSHDALATQLDTFATIAASAVFGGERISVGTSIDGVDGS